MSDKKVSIIIPCRNEVEHIRVVLNRILNQDYPASKLEIIISDGMSDDGTRDIISDYSKKHDNIILKDNPERVVPFALNNAIKASSGDIIVRMDAHSIYPTNYVSKLVYWLEKLDADNVGGVWETQARDDRPLSKAIAIGTSSSFGVGNAYYRIGIDKPKRVDTVPFGCYKKEVFDKIGLFDEDLIRNQDDEFNARLINNGGKIFLIPEVVIKYFPRNTLGKIWKMFYQYGYYKPLVNVKTGKPATWRQFVPSLFILSLVITLSGSILSVYSFWLFLSILILYLGTSLIYSLLKGMDKGIGVALALPVVFICIHFGYGLGYFQGVFDFMILGMKKPRQKHTGITR